MDSSFLPIGSIVTVKNVDVMICSYIKKGKLINNTQYDYVCCSYPNGMNDNAILIKRDDVDRIKFIGFQDKRFVELKKNLGVDS